MPDPTAIRARWVEWARSSRAPLSAARRGGSWDDLIPLGEAIGDARLVALSEALHGAAGPLEFRNRLLQYLVQEKGFTAIAIESGIVEGRKVDDYVRGAGGDLQTVAAQGIGWNFDRLPQNLALLSWLERYNCDPGRTRKVSFYGFDVAGLFSRTHPWWSHQIALRAALSFLESVDGPASHVFRKRLEPFLELRFHPRGPVEGAAYGALNQSQRDGLTAAIDDLIVWLELHEAHYSLESAAQEYAWAHRSAVAARQLDRLLRRYPVGWLPSSEESASTGGLPAFLAETSDVRDRAQADNIEWILQQQGPAGKVLVYGARYHLSATPLRASWHPHRQESEQQVAGTYLRRRYGRQFCTIGHLIRPQGPGGMPEDSLDSLAAEVGVPIFWLSLERAPEDIAQWLNQEHTLAAATQRLKLSPRRAFDILLYTQS